MHFRLDTSVFQVLLKYNVSFTDCSNDIYQFVNFPHEINVMIEND